MTQHFGDTAPQWACVAAQFLGWRPNEFWSATPDELALALSDPAKGFTGAAVSREQITQMMERDTHG